MTVLLRFGLARIGLLRFGAAAGLMAVAVSPMVPWAAGQDTRRDGPSDPRYRTGASYVQDPSRWSPRPLETRQPLPPPSSPSGGYPSGDYRHDPRRVAPAQYPPAQQYFAEQRYRTQQYRTQQPPRVAQRADGFRPDSTYPPPNSPQHVPSGSAPTQANETGQGPYSPPGLALPRPFPPSGQPGQPLTPPNQVSPNPGPTAPQRPIVPLRPPTTPPYSAGPNANGQARPDGQTYPPRQPAAGSRQPDVTASAPRAPFVLNPQQQADVDNVLVAWERASEKTKTFKCSFTRWKYDVVFQPDQKPVAEDQGVLKFAAPDKGLYEVSGDRPEKWICNGSAIYQFDYTTKTLREHQLPPELQGKAIADGPLPFIFGAKADKLRQRYFIRLATPADVARDQIWLEAYPRFQQDAAEYQRAVLILTRSSLQPYAIQLFSPGGKEWVTHVFAGQKTNDLLSSIFGDDFWHPRAPSGWRRDVVSSPSTDNPQAPQTPRSAQTSPPATTPRRW